MEKVSDHIKFNINTGRIPVLLADTINVVIKNTQKM